MHRDMSFPQSAAFLVVLMKGDPNCSVESTAIPVFLMKGDRPRSYYTYWCEHYTKGTPYPTTGGTPEDNAPMD